MRMCLHDRAGGLLFYADHARLPSLTVSWPRWFKAANADTVLFATDKVLVGKLEVRWGHHRCRAVTDLRNSCTTTYQVALPNPCLITHLPWVGCCSTPSSEHLVLKY